MSTRTYTTLTASRRTRALSLVASRYSPLLNLPSELILGIIQLALLECKPTQLAAISKGVKQLVDAIVYHTVVLDNPTIFLLFYRTVTSAKSAHLAGHVRNLIFTWTPYSFCSVKHLVSTCTSLRSLSLPSSTAIDHVALNGEGPYEITIESFDRPIDYLFSPHQTALCPPYAGVSKALTHLRICEPSDAWHSPNSILNSFGPLPNLTHLHLARQTNGNEENDEVFVRELASVLRSRPMLKLLIVSIYCRQQWEPLSSVEESNIWGLMRDLSASDARVLLLSGNYGEWRNEAQNTAACSSAALPSIFWATAEGARL
ncbi:hypothetical protein AMATHDRAFT_57492 [Amanita thiersii Skay4041]|uniref:F-box domain-containing protein n=1 Tax=Amanita thiersii Skay4041 TaxID=703135 RepID=A0A2A9NV09_9AGAR|nr:hypothetical protein AMATHDRAFT_57492 [Amanita thiersii Skay4041]